MSVSFYTLIWLVLASSGSTWLANLVLLNVLQKWTDMKRQLQASNHSCDAVCMAYRLSSINYSNQLHTPQP